MPDSPSPTMRLCFWLAYGVFLVSCAVGGLLVRAWCDRFDAELLRRTRGHSADTEAKR